MAVYGPVRHQKYIIWTSEASVHICFWWRTGPYTAIWPSVPWTICYIDEKLLNWHYKQSLNHSLIQESSYSLCDLKNNNLLDRTDVVSTVSKCCIFKYLILCFFPLNVGKWYFVTQMTTDIFDLCLSQSGFFLIHDLSTDL
jgi:hypothetical protein